MDYGYIVNRAFQIAWKYKSLWVFGLFVGGFTNFNVDLPTNSFSFDPESAELPFHISPEIIAALLLVGFVLFILFLAAYCISAPALIDGVNRIERGGVYRFGASFSAGVDYFFRILGLGVLYFLTVFVSMVILTLIFIFVAILAGVSLGDSGAGPAIAIFLLGLLILIPLLLFVYLIIMTPFSLAQRVIVVRNAPISDALSEGWLLFKRNFGKSMLIYLINLGISLAVIIALAVLFAVVALIVIIFVPDPMEHITEFIILGIVFGLPISLLLGGFFGTFHSALYTLFYFELVEPAAGRQIAAQTPPIIPGTAG
ncbi:MAG: hypothetical protein RBT76_08240 [candidate division Zixibacteria bacterium]|jgi:hypothetical protein|nr:hypothetical protein [candidate division Zixibacteria bacterium]